MGEILGRFSGLRHFNPYRIGLITIAAIIFIAAIFESPAKAEGTGRSLVMYTGGRCATLFLPWNLPGPIVTFKQPKRVIMQETGFVDSSGKPILRPVDLDNLESLTEAPPILLAGSKAIYNDRAIKDIVDGGTKIHEEVKATYDLMTKRGQNRFIVLPPSLKALDPLYESMPNFREALDIIKKSLAMSIAAGEPVHIPNLILLGDPGLGKTRFAKAIAKALGTSYEFISMNSMSGDWLLSGLGVNWKGASLGLVAKTLIEKDFANPVIVVDEIDKAGQHEGKKTISALYQLWEKDTAAEFKDEFIGVPIDASHINWIATANYISEIPKPILGRATVVEIPQPTKDQMRAVIPSIMADRIAKHPKLNFSATISDEVFLRLYTFSPRQIDKLLEDAMGNAVMDGRRQLEARDINTKVLEQTEKKRGIGFLAEGF